LKTLRIFLAGFLGFLSLAQAQDSEIDRRSHQFSAYYEALVSQALARYYNSNSYMVDARVALTDLSKPLPESLASAVQTAPASTLADSAIDAEMARNPDNLNALPGLPVLPDQMRGAHKPMFHLDSNKIHSPAPTPVTRHELGVQFIDLTVLVDTVYSPADVEFILELVRMVAKLDDNRGDLLQVRKKIFPRMDRSLDDHRVHTDSAVHPVEALKVDSAQLRKPWDAYWEQLPSLIPLMLILVFLTVIVFMVVRGLRSTPQIPPELFKRLETAQNPVVPAVIPEAPKPVPPPPEAAEQAVFETQRTICLNALIGDPVGGALMLKNWIETDRTKGLSDTAIFVESLDTKVLEILRPHLPAQDIKSIQLQMDMQTMPPLDERVTLLRTFHKDLRTLRSRSSEGTISDIFGFLHQLSTPQLLHILKDEPVGIVGLALAQIPGERAGLILQQMDPDFRAQVLVGMGQIDTIPVQAYKEVANRLSRKALEVGNMRFVAADGVQTVLDIVQGLGLVEQSEYLRSIAERDLNMAGRLRRFYALFDELPELPETVLVKVLNIFDREQLVSALVGTEVEFREKLLSAVPSRMRMAVESGIEGKQDQSPLETERARKALLAAVRTELQNSGGRT